MAKVVLVYPKTGFDVLGGSVDPPMSVLCAATLVAQEYEVQIIDARVNPNWIRMLNDALTGDTLCVGISCMTGPQIEGAVRAAAIVKTLSDVPVVFGGVHPTLFPEQTLAHPYVDYVVVGEGENAFLSLVKNLGRTRIVQSSRYVNLDKLPPPPYHLLPMESYVGTQGRFHSPLRALIFFGSRGCPYHCGYCCNEELHHGTLRRMSVQNIYERSKALVEEYSLDAIMYHDEDFFISPKRVHELADLIDGQWKWHAQVRMDSVLKVDLERLWGAGLINIQAGIESGSPRVLNYINKGETIETMMEANRRLAQTPIVPLYNFMIGFPTETRAELLETLDAAMRMLDENPNAEMTGTYIYVPYPGTPLYEEAVKCGFSPPQSLTGWTDFTRQAHLLPWLTPEHRRIQTMSKFIDGTRMVRRMRDNGEAGRFRLFLLKGQSLWYRRQWRRHKFGGVL